MFFRSKTWFSSAYDEGKGVYMHSVFFSFFKKFITFKFPQQAFLLSYFQK